MTKVISIRLEDKLHKNLKLQMVNDETTFQEYVMELIEKDRKSREEKI